MFKIKYQFVNLSAATILVTIINIALLVLLGIIIILVIKALLKYLKSGQVKEEKSAMIKSLGEALKENRTRCKMTQEFVAQALGVTRQAVSKWEKGTSDPNTSNLLALAKLYNISVQELVQKIDNQKTL